MYRSSCYNEPYAPHLDRHVPFDAVPTSTALAVLAVDDPTAAPARVVAGTVVDGVVTRAGDRVLVVCATPPYHRLVTVSSVGASVNSIPPARRLAPGTLVLARMGSVHGRRLYISHEDGGCPPLTTEDRTHSATVRPADVTQCGGPLSVHLDAQVSLSGGRTLSLPSLYMNTPVPSASGSAAGALRPSFGFILHNLPGWPGGCTVRLGITVVDAGGLPAVLPFTLITDTVALDGEFVFPTTPTPGKLVGGTARWTTPTGTARLGPMTSAEPMIIELQPITAPLALHIVGVRFELNESNTA